MERDIIRELIDEYNKSAAKIARDKLDNLNEIYLIFKGNYKDCLLYTSPSPRDRG